MFDYFDGFYQGGKGAKRLRDYKLQRKIIAGGIFYHLLEMVMGRFKYDLPPGMDARYLELCLINDGRAAIKKMPDGNIRNYQAIANGTIGDYGYPYNVELIGYTGKTYGKMLTDKGAAPELLEQYPDEYGVLAFDNKTMTAPVYRIAWYADRLTQIQSAINAALLSIRGTTIYYCTKEQERTLRKAIEDSEDGKPVIISFTGREALQEHPEIITNPASSDILKILTETYDKTMADFLTEFGINSNGVINKMVGVSPDELARTAEVTDIALHAALDARRDALDRLNAMYETNATVEIAFTDLKAPMSWSEDKDKDGDSDPGHLPEEGKGEEE